MKWDTLPQRFFSDEFLNKLYRDFKVESAIQETLQEKLERSAKKWYFYRTEEAVDASPRELRHALSVAYRRSIQLPSAGQPVIQ